MATGIFTLRNQLQGLIQKAWYGNTQPILPTFSSYAGVFSSSGQYLTTPSLSFTGNFTIEGWVYQNSTSGNTPGPICIGDCATSSGVSVYVGNGFNTVSAYVNGTLTSVNVGASSNTWIHLAAVRNGTTVTVFYNGQNVLTLTGSSTTISGIAYIGAVYYSGGVYRSNGLLSNVRVTNTAVYTSNFTPPTAPLTAISGTQLLTLQNATIIDNSSNAYTITNNGSVTTASQTISVNQTIYQPSNSTPAVEYLVVAGGGSGGGNGGGGGAGGLLQGIVPVVNGTTYTVTVGAGGTGGTYPTNNPGNNSVFANITAIAGGKGGGDDAAHAAGNGGSGGGQGYYTAGGNGQGTSGQGNAGGLQSGVNLWGGGGGAGTVGLNAVSGGVANGGAGIASSISGTVTAYAGGGGGGANSSTGGIGGVGGGGNSGTYQGVAGSGTVNTGGGGGGSSGGSGTSGTGGSGICIISYPDTYNAPTTLTGTYTASTSGSGSFAPLNTSSWIYYNAPSNLQFGTGDFTIEMWVYLTSTSGTNYLVDFRGTNAPTGSSFGIFQNSGGLQTYSTNLNVNYGMPSANTWYNVVWSRTSGVSYFFVNGTLVNAGGTADTTSYTAGTNGPSFGGNVYYSNFGLQGYMSNVRVLKGTGLYTSNFTPSTKPLTAITNTSLLLSTVSGAYLADGSTNANTASVTGTVSWNQASPFATGLGYKNRVYTWTASGTVTF